MSVNQTQRELNQLDNKIAALEKKRAELEKKEADITQKINILQRSITKNTSASTRASKSNQIQSYQDGIVKISRDKANLTKKIADKKKSRTNKVVKLQKEETAEHKKEDKSRQAVHRSYKRTINELTSQIRHQVSTPQLQPASAFASNAEIDSEAYDIFVSYASEDKKELVDELVEELKQLGVKVWYDKQRISWGDSIRVKIDAGLGKSKFGVVIISPSYIAEGKYWTRTELDALFQVESVNGKTILPIWHNITKKEVLEYSPIIAGRSAMITALMTPKKIANELAKLLSKVDEEQTN